ncbi:MAG TPA: outer membrane protein transport protein [Anaeromyxobacter sp.]|nr:outer membrane protein transport protein [Anaeromyxobacter sp.]
MKKIALLALILPAVVLANGYDVPNVNPRDLAMTSAGTADQGDAAAAFANPSALSKLEGVNLALAGSILNLTDKWSGTGAQTGESSTTRSAPVPPVSLFAAYGFKLADHNAAVGLGLNLPAGGRVFWNEQWPGRNRIITVDRKIYAVYLTAGYEILPQLRFGGGLVYYYGTEYLKQGVAGFADAYGELSAKGGAPSFDLSAQYGFPQFPLTLGVDFKYKATMKLKGNGRFVVPEGVLPNNPDPPIDQGVSHHLTYPSVLNVGASYRITEPWVVDFTWTWNDYSVYQTDRFVGDKGTTLEVPRHYRDGYTYRLGTAYAVTKNLELRAGVERDLTGLDRDFASASLPDSNTWAAGLGFGWGVIRDLSLETAFFYAWEDKVNVTGTQEFPGSYTTRVWVASLGLKWKLGL